MVQEVKRMCGPGISSQNSSRGAHLIPYMQKPYMQKYGYMKTDDRKSVKKFQFGMQ